MKRNDIIIVLFILCVMASANTAFSQDSSARETEPSPYSVQIKEPWRADAGLFRAEALLVQENYMDAILFLDGLLERNKFIADAYAYRAFAYLELNKPDKAYQDIRYALNINGRHMGTYNYLGRYHLLQDDIKLAKEQLSALRQLCNGEDCLEYKDLKYRIRKIELSEED